MSETSPFRTRTVIGMVVAGVVFFIAFLVLVAFGGSIGGGRDGRAHALSHSAIGFSGLYDFAGNFMEVGQIRSWEAMRTEDLVILTPQSEGNGEAIRNILKMRIGKATLIILPKWHVSRDPQWSGWVRSQGARGSDRLQWLTQTSDMVVAGGDREAARGENLLDGVTVRLPARTRLAEGKELFPLIVARNGRMLIARLGDGPHYLLTDPDILNNQGIDDPANARAALAILRGLNSTGAEGVHFDLTLAGFGNAGAPNALLRAFQPPFLVMTLALFAAALLAGLHGAVRFGPAARTERPIAFGKAALVENSAGLIRLARRETRMGRAYADLVRSEAARAAGAPAHLGASEMDRYLERARPGFAELAGRLGAVRSTSELTAAARALFQWKKDLIK